MLRRKYIIYYLIVFSLLLIILNISVEVSNQKEEKTLPVISQSEIENKFAIALNEFGISNSWVKKIFVRKKLSDSLSYLFSVSIPEDITIATLIKDVNSSFVQLPVEVESIEKKNYGSSVLKIYSDGILKLQANLNYSKEAKRDFAQYSFLVTNPFLEENNKNNILDHVFYRFTYLLVPSKRVLAATKGMNNNYAILLNDLINESEFALKEDFSKQKLINNIRSIIIGFGKDKAYLIDEHSVLFNSKIYSMLRDEFKSRGIKLHSLQKYPVLKGNSNEQLISLFHFYTTSLKGKEGKTFIVNSDDFLALQLAIAKQIKMGDKVVEVKF